VNEIETKLKELANARANAWKFDLQAKKIIEKAKASDEYQNCTKEKIKAEGLVEELEQVVNDWALANFDGSNKKPHLKVSIKTFDTSAAKYDPKKATEWCLKNFTPAVKLDAKVFEKAVLDGSVPEEVATVVSATENRVQIAADLSDYLEV